MAQSDLDADVKYAHLIPQIRSLSAQGLSPQSIEAELQSIGETISWRTIHRYLKQFSDGLEAIDAAEGLRVQMRASRRGGFDEAPLPDQFIGDLRKALDALHRLSDDPTVEPVTQLASANTAAEIALEALALLTEIQELTGGVASEGSASSEA